MESKPRRFDVFIIHEYTQDKQIKSLWTRVGSAFENADGSWNLRLRALPLANPKTGLADLHMREPRPSTPDIPHTEGQEDGFVYNPDYSSQRGLV